MNKTVTEKTPKAIDDLEEVSWETLHNHVRGGMVAGQNRSDVRHDKSRRALK